MDAADTNDATETDGTTSSDTLDTEAVDACTVYSDWSDLATDTDQAATASLYTTVDGVETGRTATVRCRPGHDLSSHTSTDSWSGDPEASAYQVLSWCFAGGGTGTGTTDWTSGLDDEYPASGCPGNGQADKFQIRVRVDACHSR